MKKIASFIVISLLLTSCGSSNQRAMYDFEKNGCPEALIETGAEVVLVATENLFTSDQGTNERIMQECPDAVKKGRNTNYTLNVNGIDYITQLENTNAKIPSLNQQFSQEQCEEKDVQIKNSFTNSANNVELIFPLGMASLRHVIPTDHMYIQWKNMSNAANQILSPADGYVVEAEGVRNDFRIVIELSCNQYIGFGHLDEFTGPTAKLTNEFADGHRRVTTRIPVKAGDVVALTGELMSDFWYWDQTKTLDGIRKANYITHNGMNLYAVDPFNYLTDPVSIDIEKKVIGSFNSNHGKIGWNEKDNAQGSWYQIDTFGEHGPLSSWLDNIDINSKSFFGPWDGAFSWAPDALDPTTYLVSSGTFTENGSVIGITKNNQSPLDLKPGSDPIALEIYEFEYKDENGKTFDRDSWTGRTYAQELKATATDQKIGVVILQMIDEKTLLVEKRPGNSANSKPEFSGEPTIYKR